MSLLNKLKELKLKYPDDQEFGNQVNSLIKANLTCCDDLNNHIVINETGIWPYGPDLIVTKREVCGKVISSVIDK